MLPVLCLAIFFGLGSVAITSAFATEPFPTYVRSRAAAWCRNAFEVPGGIVAPLVVGLLVSVFQVVTQIQEMTLTFIPKLVVVVALFLLLGSWMMSTVVVFARQVIGLAGGVSP